MDLGKNQITQQRPRYQSPTDQSALTNITMCYYLGDDIETRSAFSMKLTDLTHSDFSLESVLYRHSLIKQRKKSELCSLLSKHMNLKRMTKMTLSEKIIIVSKSEHTIKPFSRHFFQHSIHLHEKFCY